jgi:uncharacterized membrane protein YagU involved in acid resistance
MIASTLYTNILYYQFFSFVLCVVFVIFFSQFSRKLGQCIQLGIVIIGTTNLVYIFFNFEMD